MAVAAVAVSGAAALLIWRLSAPFGGYHGWNEGWYATLGQAFAGGQWLLAPGACGVPLGFAWMLGLGFLVGGVSEVVARGVCAVAFAGILWQTGRLAAHSGAHVPTAVALSASMPMLLVLGQNVQTDSWYVFLGLLWWNSLAGGRGRWPGLTPGLIAGVGWLIKPFILFFWAAAAAARTLQTRSLRWATEKPVRVGLIAAGLVLAPYYLYAALVEVPAGASTVDWDVGRNVALVTEVPSLGTLGILLLDFWWAAGPGVVLLGAAGLLLGARRRQPGALRLGLLAFTMAGAYWLLHYHTYYVAGIAPVFAVAVAHWLASWPARVRTGVVLGLVCWGLGYAFVFLQAKEAGQTAFADAGRWIAGEAPGGARVVLGNTLYGSYSPLINFYARPAEIMTVETGSRAAPTHRLVVRIDPVDPGRPPAPSAFVAYQERLVLRFGGRAYVLEPGNLHVFQPPVLQPAPGMSPAGPRLQRVRVPWIQVRRASVRGEAGSDRAPATL